MSLPNPHAVVSASEGVRRESGDGQCISGGEHGGLWM